MSCYDDVLRDHVALVTKAADFAARRHSGQRRKGSKAEPYINHLAEVAHLLAGTAQEPDAYLVAAGWLHDTLEDTPTMPDELRQAFGDHITSIVIEVTDDKTLTKGERKELQLVGTIKKSTEARLVKLADLTSNLRSLKSDPPVNWPQERVSQYIAWAKRVADSCRDLNEELDHLFDRAIAAFDDHTFKIEVA